MEAPVKEHKSVRTMKASSLYPADWLVATLAIVVIFTAIYFLRPDRAPLTPNEQTIQNVD
jgi:hypothetical protein